MEICGLEFVTLVFHSFPILLLSVLIFCAKKKPARADVRSGTTQGTTVAATTAETQKNGSGLTTPGKTETPTKGADEEEDDVNFNINVKKAEEKKDEFDDDEENPLAKIEVKQRNNKMAFGGKKGGPGPAGKVAEKARAAERAKNKTREEAMERPFLAPNEKQFGVSCYQFEPTQPAVTPSVTAVPPAPPPPPMAPPKKTAAQMQKSTDGGPRTLMTRTVVTAPTAPTFQASGALPSLDLANNTKSALSIPINNKTKLPARSVEQERTHHDHALEKTQKGD